MYKAFLNPRSEECRSFEEFKDLPEPEISFRGFQNHQKVINVLLRLKHRCFFQNGQKPTRNNAWRWTIFARFSAPSKPALLFQNANNCKVQNMNKIFFLEIQPTFRERNCCNTVDWLMKLASDISKDKFEDPINIQLSRENPELSDILFYIST